MNLLGTSIQANKDKTVPTTLFPNMLTLIELLKIEKVQKKGFGCRVKVGIDIYGIYCGLVGNQSPSKSCVSI